MMEEGGSGSEMDSLFEGMDFVMPSGLAYEGQNLPEIKVEEENAGNSLSGKTLLQKTNLMLASPAQVLNSLPSLSPTSVPADPLLAIHRSPSATSLSGILPPQSSSPIGSSHATVFRVPSEPLDESLFSGLSMSIVDDGGRNGSTSLGNSVDESLSSNAAPDTWELSRPSKELKSRKSGSGEWNRATVDSIIAGYNGVASNTSSLIYSTSGSGIQNKLGSISPVLSASPAKPLLRRKKRSMKVGYAREEEDQDDPSLRTNSGRDKAATIKVGLDSGDIMSFPLGVDSSASRHHTLFITKLKDDVVDNEKGSAANGGEVAVSVGEFRPPEDTATGLSSTLTTLQLESGIVPEEESSSVRDVPKIAASEELEMTVDVSGPQDSEGASDLSTRVTSDSETTLQSEKDSSTNLGDPSVGVSYGQFSVVSTNGDTSMEIGVQGSDTTIEPAGEENRIPSAAVSESSQLEKNVDLDIKSLVEVSGGTIEDRLNMVRELVAKKIQAFHGRSSEASALRKAAAQKRRQAADRVLTVSTTHKNLEHELTAACEKEDFEIAHALSESINDAERALEQAADAFREAEADYDLATGKLHEVLELQLIVEAEGAQVLETLKQEAEDAASRVYTEAQETARRDRDRLTAQEDAIGIKRSKVNLELKANEDAMTELKKTIEESTENETQEKKMLMEMRNLLDKELQDLLVIVKQKEAEIAKHDKLIAEVDAKVENVVVVFERQQFELDRELDALSRLALELDKESAQICSDNQNIEHLLSGADEDRLKLEKIAYVAFDDVLKMRAFIDLKRELSKASLQSRAKRTELTQSEKLALSEAQTLRLDVSSARTALQELSALKVKLNQEMSAIKQRVLFVEKRVPELDSGKKLAAAARNFSEAGRIAVEAKALLAEKEAAISQMSRIFTELSKVEDEENGKVTALEELDSFVATKEKEAAMAHCERLRLVAEAARIERDAAIELEDFDEGKSLDAEAEAADLEADGLQILHQLKGKQYGSGSNVVKTPIDENNI